MPCREWRSNCGGKPDDVVFRGRAEYLPDVRRNRWSDHKVLEFWKLLRALISANIRVTGWRAGVRPCGLPDRRLVPYLPPLADRPKAPKTPAKGGSAWVENIRAKIRLNVLLRGRSSFVKMTSPAVGRLTDRTHF